MKKQNLLLILTFFLIFFTGCADAVYVKECIPETAHIYGFFGGTWHGIILPFSFIGSWFSNDIAVYAISNNGFWYDFGYCGGFFTILRIIVALKRLS